MSDDRGGRALSDIQRRLRFLQFQNDRMHEQLALKIHREAVAREAGPGAHEGELDARCEAAYCTSGTSGFSNERP